MKGFCRLWYSGVSILFWYLLIIGIVAFYGSICLLISYELPRNFVYSGLWIFFYDSYLSAGILPAFFILIMMENKSNKYAYLFLSSCIFIMVLSGVNIGSLTFSSADLSNPHLWGHLSDSITRYYFDDTGHGDESSYSYPKWLADVEEKHKCCGLTGPMDYGSIIPFHKDKTETPICKRIKYAKGCVDYIKSDLYDYYYILLISSAILLFNAAIALISYITHFLNFKLAPMIIKTSVHVKLDENNNLRPQDLERICQLQMQMRSIKI